MRYAYTAYDRNGGRHAGVLEAASHTAARERLEAKRLFIAALTSEPESGRATPTTAADAAPERPALWRKDLKLVAAFTRELAILVSSGVPVADAVAAVEKQSEPERWRAVVGGIRAELERGTSLSAALEQRPDRFDPVYRSLVAAGEESGDLGGMLERLARLVRRQLVVRSAVIGATIYPLTLTLLSLAAMLAMLVLVVPKFSEMFAALNAQLPASTELLIRASAALRAYWWAGSGLVALAVPSALFAARSQRGAAAIDRLLVTAPAFSPLVRGVTEAHVARVLSTLLTAHVPLLQAMDLVHASITNREYRRVLAAARDTLSSGGGLAAGLEEGGLIRPSFVEAVRSGESTGKLARVLGEFAGHLEQDNDAAIRVFAKTIEPAVIAFMGIVVAVLALSMFLPLFDISAQAGGGGPR